MKLIIADDHQLIIDGMKAMLASEEIEIIGEATNGQEVIDIALKEPEVDMIILDIGMPIKTGFTVTKELKALYPEIKILILSMHLKSEFVSKLLAAGADGYILKNAERIEVIKAIKMLMNGEKYLAQEVSSLLAETYSELGEAGDKEREELSPREKEVAALIAKEKSTKEIAEIMGVGVNTINTHRRNILSKLDVKNAAGITRFAILTGLVTTFNN